MQVWLGQVQIMLDHKLRDESDIVHCSLVRRYYKIFKVSTCTVNFLPCSTPYDMLSSPVQTLDTHCLVFQWYKAVVKKLG